MNSSPTNNNATIPDYPPPRDNSAGIVNTPRDSNAIANIQDRYAAIANAPPISKSAAIANCETLRRIDLKDRLCFQFSFESEIIKGAEDIPVLF